MLKDIATALDIATDSETEVPVSRTAVEIWRRAQQVLEPGADHTELARWYEQRSGTLLRRP